MSKINSDGPIKITNNTGNDISISDFDGGIVMCVLEPCDTYCIQKSNPADLPINLTIIRSISSPSNSCETVIIKNKTSNPITITDPIFNPEQITLNSGEKKALPSNNDYISAIMIDVTNLSLPFNPNHDNYELKASQENPPFPSILILTPNPLIHFFPLNQRRNVMTGLTILSPPIDGKSNGVIFTLAAGQSIKRSIFSYFLLNVGEISVDTSFQLRLYTEYAQNPGAPIASKDSVSYRDGYVPLRWPTDETIQNGYYIAAVNPHRNNTLFAQDQPADLRGVYTILDLLYGEIENVFSGTGFTGTVINNQFTSPFTVFSGGINTGNESDEIMGTLTSFTVPSGARFATLDISPTSLYYTIFVFSIPLIRSGNTFIGNATANIKIVPPPAISNKLIADIFVEIFPNNTYSLSITLTVVTVFF